MRARVFLGAFVVGLLLFSYRHLNHVAAADDVPFLKPLLEEMSAALSAAVLFFPVRALARRFRLDAAGWPRAAAVHLPAVVAFGASMTSMMWGLRELVSPLLGLGDYDYGRMPVRYLMEFPVQLILYSLFVSGVYAADHYGAARDRELRAAQLQGQLSRAQLENLQLRLQPHFLFNALNTISSTMYDDPATADEMMSHLAELLRASLRAQSAEVPLAQELQTLEHYLAIMRARFGDRLEVQVTSGPGTEALLVPSLLIQPLVENAVRHGSAASSGQGRIQVSARREGDRLRLEVHDDGTAAGTAGSGSGLGLSLTAERLRLLYGERHSFAAGPVEGGFLAAITIPARSAAQEPA